MIRGVDLASYQGTPDFDKLAKAGVQFTITKGTEGTGYTFPGMNRNRSEALRVGIGSGIYHFARGGNPEGEAEYFCHAVGSLRGGEVVALDWEIPANDPVTWCAAWVHYVTNHYGINPFIYLNKSTVQRYDWSPLGNNGLWLADPDGSEDMPTGLPVWGSPAIKQYSGSGQLPGINGKVDLNVFYGTLDSFRRYGAGVATPAPSPDYSSLPSLQYGDRGPNVASLQRFLNQYNWQPPLPLLPVTGNYLDQTTAVLRAAQRQMGINDGDGRNVGTQTKRGLWARGWRGQ